MEFDVCADVRVKAPNPYTDGMVLYDRLDYFPHGFTRDELDTAYYGLIREHTDYDMMMETAPFEDVDEYYNPGTEEVDPAFVTEAVVVKKFSRLEGVIRRGIVKAMNKYMTASDPTTGTPITALDPVVGKPRKSGLFAYVTVQIPFSDGQVVSIVFHAPEGDQKKISPDDTVVAFRWVLNKRDITSVVAPEDGKEISLETVAKRVGQLVEKNTKRFASTQKEVQAEKRELEETNTQIKETQNRVDRLIIDVAEGTKQIESLDAQIGTTSAALEKQKTINAELRAKLEALRKAQTPTPTPTGTGEDTSTTGGTSARYLDFKSRNWGYAGDKKTWVKDNGDGTITVKRAAKGTISKPYLEELKTFCAQYGYDFSQLKSGESITLVKTQAGTDTSTSGTSLRGLEIVYKDTKTNKEVRIVERGGILHLQIDDTVWGSYDTLRKAENGLKKAQEMLNFEELRLVSDTRNNTGTGTSNNSSSRPTKPLTPAYDSKGARRIDILMGDFHVTDDEARYFYNTLGFMAGEKVMPSDFEAELNRLRDVKSRGEDLYSLDSLFDMYEIPKKDPRRDTISKNKLTQSYGAFTKREFEQMAAEEGVSLADSTPDQGNTPPDATPEPAQPEYKKYAGLVNAEKDFLAALSKDEEMQNAIKDGDEAKAMSRLSSMLSNMENGYFGGRMGDNFAENRYGFRDGLTKTVTDWVKQSIEWANRMKEKMGTGATDQGAVAPNQTTPEVPAFVQDMNDILAGKYDNDSRRIIDMLEKALDEAEKPGNEQYMDLVDKASNYYTEILSKEAM